jgi:hypothetical protein
VTRELSFDLNDDVIQEVIRLVQGLILLGLMG